MNEEKTPFWTRLFGGKRALFLLLGLCGVALLLFGGRLTSTPDKEEEAVDGSEVYRLRLESELTDLCRDVAGVGDVSVFLTLATGEQAVYAVGQSGGISLSGGQGILLRTDPPAVSGVTVVCRGGADPAVRETLITMLSSTLGIGSNRVSVVAKK